MKRPGRATALLCALALVCALVLPVWGAPSTPVYLLVANDKFCDLPGNALPVAINGIIYIPYSTFDRNLTGVDLGVYYGITPEHGTVLTLYSRNRTTLTFHLNMSTCEDDQGNVMNFFPATRNGIPYVPASAVCDFFGLQYSFLPTADRGIAIRLSDPSTPHMDDSTFLTSARSAMTTRYNQVLQNLSPQPSAPVSTTAPTPTPAVSAPPAGSNEDIRLYLSLDASQWTGELTSLFPMGVHALLLFTPDSLPDQSSLIRRAVAAGHSVGILLDGSLDGAAALAELDRANDLLSHIARVKTRTVALSSPSSSLEEALRDDGWVLWRPNLRGPLDPNALQATLGTRPALFRVDLSATRAPLIPQVVSALRREGYSLQRPLETEL